MHYLTINPRAVSEKDFPATGRESEQLHFLLNYAVLAPSEYNAQPWLFNIQGNYVDLYADRSRSLPVVDPDERELTISCGAAFLNLRIALRYFGYEDNVEVLSACDDAHLLARLSSGQRHNATLEDRLLFHAIPQRRSNRHIFEPKEVPASLLATLEHVAGFEGTWFHIVRHERDREAVTSLIATGDRMQWAEKHFRRELATWVRREDHSDDGLPLSAHAKGSSAAAISPFVVRTVNLGSGEAAKDRQLAATSPILAVLGTFTDTRGDWFAAGQAIERILLHACAEHVQASFVNQPIEVPSLRTQLRDIVGRTGFPQLVIRMGYGSEVPFTPRRSVSEVLL